ncbi:MAG: DUF6082 family protein [Candidatus Thiodiazotropha sp.]
MRIVLFIVSALLIGAFFSYMFVLIQASDSAFALNNLDISNLNKSIHKAALFGDSFGVFSSLFSGAALIGLLYTILQQREELKLQREEMSKGVATQLRQLHYSLTSMAMDDPCLTAVWEEKGEITDICFKQKSLVNLILSHWEMQFEHGLLSKAQVEETLNKYMKYSYFSKFWELAHQHRKSMSEKSDSKKAKQFHDLAQEAYNKANPADAPKARAAD